MLLCFGIEMSIWISPSCLPFIPSRLFKIYSLLYISFIHISRYNHWLKILDSHTQCTSLGSTVGKLVHSARGSWVRYPVRQHASVSPSAFPRRAVVSYWRKYVHEVLVNRLGGLSLPRKSVVRLTDRPDMTLDAYRGRKIAIQPIPHPVNELWLYGREPGSLRPTPLGRTAWDQ